MKLLLIYHGQSRANTEGQLDSPLTDTSWSQARAPANRLLRDEWNVRTIHSSEFDHLDQRCEDSLSDGRSYAILASISPCSSEDRAVVS